MSMSLQSSPVRQIPQNKTPNNVEQNNKRNSCFNLFSFVKAAMVLGAVGGLPVIRAVLDNEGSVGTHLRSNSLVQPDLNISSFSPKSENWEGLNVSSGVETHTESTKNILTNDAFSHTLNPIEMVDLMGSYPNTIFTCSETLSVKLDISSHSWPQYNSQPCFKFPTLPDTSFSYAQASLFVTELHRGYGGPVSQMKVSLYKQDPNKISEQFTTWNTMQRTAKTHGTFISELTPSSNQWLEFDVSNFVTPSEEFAVCLEVSTPENGAVISCESNYLPKLQLNTLATHPTPSPTIRTNLPTHQPSSGPSKAPTLAPINPSSTPSTAPTEFSSPAPTTYTPPVLVSQIQNKETYVNSDLVFSVVPSFNGIGLAFTAELNGGQSLPTFIQFIQGEFSVQPNTGDQGLYSVLVTATDNAGVSVSDIFDITVPNRGINLIGSFETQAITAGESFDFVLPVIFEDLDNDGLVYVASLGNNNPLPNWLLFNPDTRRFVGSAPDELVGESVALKVSVTDPYGESKSDVFNLEINEKPVKKEDSFDWGLFTIVAPIVGFFSFLVCCMSYKLLNTTVADNNTDIENQQEPVDVNYKPVAQAVTGTAPVYTAQVEVLEKRVEERVVKNDGNTLAIVPSAPPASKMVNYDDSVHI